MRERIDERCELHRGDCREVLASLEAESFSACVTDPPYELGFMGKAWDRSGIAFDPRIWSSVLRVLKPGGMLLAFGGTRTFHRLVVAIEDAGFEIRDSLCWLYGSGFPKSLNLGKAIDRSKGLEVSADGYSPNGKNRTHGEGWGGGRKTSPSRPASSSAWPWRGHGTALKPSHEPICLAMKPLEGTFAANALKHGVAGLNVDGARIGTDGGRTRSDQAPYGKSGWRTGHEVLPLDAGRFPSNLLLDEEAARMLDGSAPASTSSDRERHNTAEAHNRTASMGSASGDWTSSGHADAGGPSRFFYTAKASSAERGRGNRHPTVKPLDLMTYLCRLVRPPRDGRILDPFLGSGTTALAALETNQAFVGIEKDETSFETAVARIRGHDRDGYSISTKDDQAQLVLLMEAE